MEKTPDKRRGRPPIEPSLETVLAVIEWMRLHPREPYVAACEACGTSRHVMAKARATWPAVDYDVRLAVARWGPRKLADGDADPALIAEIDAEARRLDIGQPARSWEQIQKDMTRRADTMSAMSEARAPVVIPEPAPGEEMF